MLRRDFHWLQSPMFAPASIFGHLKSPRQATGGQDAGHAISGQKPGEVPVSLHNRQRPNCTDLRRAAALRPSQPVGVPRGQGHCALREATDCVKARGTERETGPRRLRHIDGPASGPVLRDGEPTIPAFRFKIETKDHYHARQLAL